MSVIAHQGGWDEALFVAVPMAVFAVLLWVANRRARRALGAEPQDRAQANSGER